MRSLIVVFFILAAISTDCKPVSASESSAQKPSVEDALVGSMFKTMAKTYLAAVDIEKFKANNISRVNGFNEESFRRHYARFLRVAGKSPRLKKEFGLSPDMAKEKAISLFRSLDKKKLYRMIDAVPDQVVNDEFKLYLSREKIKSRNRNIGDQVKMVWANLQQGLE
jgi:hypothetical protein